MSHFGVVAPPFLGHLNPMQDLAGVLVARGHRVTFFGMPDMEALLRRDGWYFMPLAGEGFPPGTLTRMNRHMAAPRGPGLFRIMGDMVRTTTMLCRDLPAACRAQDVDVLLVDQLEPAGGLVAAHLGLPFVSVANALPINRDPSHPPPFTNWRHDTSEWGLTRNRGGYRVADLLMRSVNRNIARQSNRLGLAQRQSLDDCLSPFAEVTQLVPELDFPRATGHDTWHPCGPLRRDDRAEEVGALLDKARPLVFASLGTLQGGRFRVFSMIAEACAALGLHLVIAHGGRLAARDIAALPGAPVVQAFVAQRALLRHAALAIVNGGLNTVLDAIGAGVPVLVLPIAFEQGAVGARVVHAGVGLSVPPGRLTAGRLKATIAELLGRPHYAEQARTLASAITTAGGAERAATVIEAVASGRRPMTRTGALSRRSMDCVEPA